MGQVRRRPASRSKASGRGGIPWGWLGILVLIGGAVLAVRTLRVPLLDQARSAEPELSPVAALTHTPLPVHTPSAATAPIAAPAVETPPPTPRPPTSAPHTPVVAAAAAAAAATPTVAGHARATASAPTRTPVAAQAAATHAPAPQTPAPHAPATPAPQHTPAASSAVGTGGMEAGGAAAVAAASNGAGTGTGASSGAAGSVALTFDAGADRGYAQDILDTLADEHVVGSFGVTGVWAKANPELVRRMASDGHFVFDHTLDHKSFTGVSDQLGGLSPARRRQELEDADAIIAPLIGHSTRPWYRLPYGDDDAHVAADVAPAGYTQQIGWTVDSQGWRGLLPTDILARCLKLAAPGAVYVFHVGEQSRDAIALPQIIQGLRDKGFTFKRIDQG